MTFYVCPIKAQNRSQICTTQWVCACIRPVTAICFYSVYCILHGMTSKDFETLSQLNLAADVKIAQERETTHLAPENEGVQDHLVLGEECFCAHIAS